MSDTTLKVNYKNELNLVPMKNFNSKEMDLFFSICAKMKNQGLDKVQFSFEELKYLSDYKFTGNDRFVKDLERVYKKMLNLSYRTDEIDDEGDRVIDHFVLFTHFKINVSKQFVDVSINPMLSHILNNLGTTYSKFELRAFTAIRSTYTKTLFRLLMQFKDTGFYVIKVDDFRELLDVPKSYRMANIDQTILTPAITELNQYFDNLKLKKIKARKGNKIDRFEFTFRLKNELPVIPM